MHSKAAQVNSVPRQLRVGQERNDIWRKSTGTCPNRTLAIVYHEVASRGAGSHQQNDP
jgi:hypothetical protein